MADSRMWLPFDAAEYERRQSALRARMDERGLDVVLLSGPENQYYLWPGLGSVGFSETVRVTETGCEVLTQCPRVLTEA